MNHAWEPIPPDSPPQARVGALLMAKLAVAGGREVDGVQDVEDVFFGMVAEKGAVLYVRVSARPGIDVDRTDLVRQIRAHVRHKIEQYTGVVLGVVEVELEAEDVEVARG